MARAAAGLGALSPLMALANPTGGQVVGGSATINTPNSNATVVNQTSQNAAINWQQFSVGANQYVQFIQPNSSATVLNRVIGSNPSSIFGNITANGQVFLINPNGILFAPGASLDVAGLVASTQDISTADFMAGRYNLVKASGAPDASVINQGSITTTPNGYVVLAGDYVENDGVIQAQSGRVLLAAGGGTTLTLDKNQGLIGYSIDSATLARLAGANNTGSITVDGGTVIMTADVANALTATAVNNSGFIAAHSITSRDGVIILAAVGGDIDNSGTLDASGAESGVAGGTVILHGSGLTKLDPTSVIDVEGDGAKGGFVDLSGHELRIAGQTKVGAGGSLLLDPTTLTINTGPSIGAGTGPTGSVGTGYIDTKLNAGVNVTLVASQQILKGNATTITATTGPGAGNLAVKIGTLVAGAGGTLSGAGCALHGVCLPGTLEKFAAVSGGTINLSGLTIDINGNFFASASHGVVTTGAVTAKGIVLSGTTITTGVMTATNTFSANANQGAVTTGAVTARYIFIEGNHITTGNLTATGVSSSRSLNAVNLFENPTGSVAIGMNIGNITANAGGRVLVHTAGRGTGKLKVGNISDLHGTVSFFGSAVGSVGTGFISAASINAKAVEVTTKTLSTVNVALGKISASGALTTGTNAGDAVYVKNLGGGVNMGGAKIAAPAGKVVMSGGFLSLGSVSAGGALSVNAQETSPVAATISVTPGKTLKAQSVSLNASASYGGIISAGAISATGGSMVINAIGKVGTFAGNNKFKATLGNLTATGAVQVLGQGSAGSVAVGSINAKGVTANAAASAKNAKVTTGKIVSTGGVFNVNVSETGPSGSLNVGSISAAGVGVIVTAGNTVGGNITLGNVITSKYVKVSTNAGGIINLNNITATGVIGGTTSLAPVAVYINDTAVPGSVHAISSSKITATTGAVKILGGTVALGSISAAAGALDVKAHETGPLAATISVTAGKTLKAQSVTLNASASYGGIITASTIDATGGSIIVNAKGTTPTLGTNPYKVSLGNLTATAGITVSGIGSAGSVKMGSANAAHIIALASGSKGANKLTTNKLTATGTGVAIQLTANAPVGAASIVDSSISASNGRVVINQSGHGGNVIPTRISAPNGSIDITANDTVTGATITLGIASAKIIEVNQIGSAAGKTTLGSITATSALPNSGSLAGDALVIKAGQGSVGVAGAQKITAHNGNVAITTGNVTLGSVSAGGNLVVTARKTGPVSATISVNGADVLKARSVNLTASASYGGFISAHGITATGGSIALKANAIHATNSANINAGNLTATAGGVNANQSGPHGHITLGTINAPSGSVHLMTNDTGSGGKVSAGTSGGQIVAKTILVQTNAPKAADIRINGTLKAFGAFSGSTSHGKVKGMGIILNADATGGANSSGGNVTVNNASSQAVHALGGGVRLHAHGGLDSGGKIIVNGGILATGLVDILASNVGSCCGSVSLKNVTGGAVQIKALGKGTVINVGAITATGTKSSGTIHDYVRMSAGSITNPANGITIGGQVKSSHGSVAIAAPQAPVTLGASSASRPGIVAGTFLRVQGSNLHLGSVSAGFGVSINAAASHSNVAVIKQAPGKTIKGTGVRIDAAGSHGANINVGNVIATSGNISIAAMPFHAATYSGSIVAGTLTAGRGVSLTAKGAGAAGADMAVGNIIAGSLGSVGIFASHQGAAPGFTVKTGNITGKDVLVKLTGEAGVFKAGNILATGLGVSAASSCSGECGTNRGLVRINIVQATPNSNASINIAGTVKSSHSYVGLHGSVGKINVTGNISAGKSAVINATTINVGSITAASAVSLTGVQSALTPTTITASGLVKGHDVVATVSLSSTATKPGSIDLAGGASATNLGSPGYINLTATAAAAVKTKITTGALTTALRRISLFQKGGSGSVVVTGGMAAGGSSVDITTSDTGLGGNINVTGNVSGRDVRISARGNGGGDIAVTGSLHANGCCSGIQLSATAGATQAGGNVIVSGPITTTSGRIRIHTSGGGLSGGRISVGAMSARSSVSINANYHGTAAGFIAKTGAINAQGVVKVAMTGKAPHFSAAGITAKASCECGSNGVKVVLTPSVASGSSGVINITGPVIASEAGLILNPGHGSVIAGAITANAVHNHRGNITINGSVINVGAITDASGSVKLTGSRASRSTGITVTGPITTQKVTVGINLPGSDSFGGVISLQSVKTAGSLVASPGINISAIKHGGGGSMRINTGALKASNGNILVTESGAVGNISVGSLTASGKINVTTSIASGGNIRVNGGVSAGGSVKLAASASSGGNITVTGNIKAPTNNVLLTAGGVNGGGNITVGNISAGNSVILTAQGHGGITGKTVNAHGNLTVTALGSHAGPISFSGSLIATTGTIRVSDAGIAAGITVNGSIDAPAGSIFATAAGSGGIHINGSVDALHNVSFRAVGSHAGRISINGSISGGGEGVNLTAQGAGHNNIIVNGNITVGAAESNAAAALNASAGANAGGSISVAGKITSKSGAVTLNAHGGGVSGGRITVGSISAHNNVGISAVRIGASPGFVVKTGAVTAKSAIDVRMNGLAPHFSAAGLAASGFVDVRLLPTGVGLDSGVIHITGPVVSSNGSVLLKPGVSTFTSNSHLQSSGKGSVSAAGISAKHNIFITGDVISVGALTATSGSLRVAGVADASKPTSINVSGNVTGSNIAIDANGIAGGNVTVTGNITATRGNATVTANANPSHSGGNVLITGNVVAPSGSLFLGATAGAGVGGNINVGNITVNNGVNISARYTGASTGFHVKTGTIDGGYIAVNMEGKDPLFSAAGLAGHGHTCECSANVFVLLENASFAAALGGSMNITGPVTATNGGVKLNAGFGVLNMNGALISAAGSGNVTLKGGQLHLGSVSAAGHVSMDAYAAGAQSAAITATPTGLITAKYVNMNLHNSGGTKGGQIAVGAIDATGTGVPASSGNITINGILPGKRVTVSAGTLTATKAVSLVQQGSAGSVIVTGPISGKSVKITTADTGSGSISVGKVTATGGSVSLAQTAASGAVHIGGSISAAGAVSILAKNTAATQASINVTGNIQAAKVKLLASGSHSGRIAVGNITANGAVTGFPSHSVGGSIVAETTQLLPTVTSRRGIVITGDLSATGRIQVFGTNISVGGVNAGGEMFLSADGTSARHATVTASKAIVFGAYGSIEAQGPSGSIHVGDVTATNAEVSFFASGAAGHPGTITVGNVTAKNYVAFFADSKTGTVNVGTIKASNSYVSVSAAKLTTTGPVTAASYVSFYGGKFNVGGAVTAGAYVQMRGTQLNVAGPITAGSKFGVILPGPFHTKPVSTGYVKLFANSAAGKGSINVTGAVSGRTDSISAKGLTSAAVNLAGVTATTGPVTILGGQVQTGSLSAAGAVHVTAGSGNIVVNGKIVTPGNNPILNAAGSLTVTAAGSQAFTGGSLIAGKAVHLHATGALKLSNVTLTDSAFSASAGSNLTLAATGNLNLAGRKAVASKTLSLSATGNVLLGGAVIGGSAVDITAVAITNSSAGGSITAGTGALKATGGGIVLKGETLHLTAGAGFLLSAHSNVDLSAVTATGAGKLNVQAGGAVNATSITYSAAGLQITAAGPLTLTNATVTAAGGIDLNANSVALGAAALKATGALALHVTHDIGLAHATLSGSAVNASAGGNLTNSGANVVIAAGAGGLSLKAKGGISLGGETLHVGGAALLSASGSLDLIGDTVTAVGNMTLHGATLAENLASLTAGGALTETGGAIDLTSATLTAGGSLNLHANANLKLANAVLAGSGVTALAGSIGNSGSAGDITGGAGGLKLKSAGAITLDGETLKVSGGNATFSAAGNISLTGALMTASSAHMVAAGSVDLSGITLTASKTVQLVANKDIILSGVNITANTFIADASGTIHNGGGPGTLTANGLALVAGKNINMTSTQISIGTGSVSSVHADTLLLEELAGFGIAPTSSLLNGAFIAGGSVALGGLTITGHYLELQGTSVAVLGKVTAPVSGLLVQVTPFDPTAAIGVEDQPATTQAFNLSNQSFVSLFPGATIAVGDDVESGAVFIGANGALTLAKNTNLFFDTTGPVTGLGTVTSTGLVTTLGIFIATTNNAVVTAGEIDPTAGSGTNTGLGDQTDKKHLGSNSTGGDVGGGGQPPGPITNDSGAGGVCH